MLKQQYLPLRAFLALLPGVKPRIAADELLNAAFNTVIESDPPPRHFTYGDRRIDLDFFFEQMATDNYWDVKVTSPQGAAFLIELYEAGCLPMTVKAPQAVPQAALDYANSAAKLEQAERERLQAEADFAAKLNHLEQFTELDFEQNEALLSRLFWHHLPNGAPGTLRIGGMEVTKHVRRFTSNSGKSRDHDISFTWISSAGQPKELSLKTSSYQHNRRNDADRNWGLGRE